MTDDNGIIALARYSGRPDMIPLRGPRRAEYAAHEPERRATVHDTGLRAADFALVQRLQRIQQATVRAFKKVEPPLHDVVPKAIVVGLLTASKTTIEKPVREQAMREITAVMLQYMENETRL